jgi:uncharacterized membrane protein YraQ (UPF0718 family)
VATAVAFPHNPGIVLARFLASLALAMVMGWLWVLFGSPDWLRPPPRVATAGESNWHTFRMTVQHDFLQAGGLLVVGAFFAATLNVVISPSWSSAVADHPVVGVLVLAVLAVALSVCSEADAFVAASFSGFSLTAKLAFMVVGPAVDLKLIAMQVGLFGRRFALRFAPATFVAATAISMLVGSLLL